MSIGDNAPEQCENAPAEPKSLLPEETAEQVAGRIFSYCVGAEAVFMIAVADDLGVLAWMDGKPPSTSAEVAKGTGLHERWVREMLSQLACSHVIQTDTAGERFWLTAAQAAVLSRETGRGASPLTMLPFCNMIVTSMGVRDKMPACFRTGKGMPYDAYGQPMACAVCRELGVWTRHSLIPELTTIPGLKARLEAGIKVADLGCGAGEALVTLATAFPASDFHGYDISHHALCCAKERLKHLPNVTLHNPADGDGMPEGEFDFLVTIDAIHDMAHPDKVLPIARRALRDDAAGYVVVDFKSTGSLAGNIREMREVAMVGYAFSVQLCMSSGLSEEDGLGLGTLGWHEEVAHRMLKEAGFGQVETLPWESPFNSFYLARP